ncbi:MAG TPA: glycosyltransferase [Pyrinomonadaceae bacterium]|nr:glycosyltransferase [Pyrinomonadaceae bacterium]
MKPVKQQPRKLRLTFLTRSLDIGGAQRQLVTLAKALDQSQFDVSILTFYSGQAWEGELEGSGVRIVSLDKRGRWDLFSFTRRLIREVRALQPDVLHGYLDIPNVLALLARRFVPTKVVWGVRASAMEMHEYDWLFRLAAKVERMLSDSPDLIIVNSRAAFQHHLSIGFPSAKLKLIPNGIDTDVFKPDLEARARLRKEWGVDDSIQLVGTVGRLDPVKDLPTFLAAATNVSRDQSSARFICVGNGPPEEVERLKALTDELKISNQVIFTGAVSDVAAAYNALDLLVSSSRAESFPNSVAEAMACGIRCVVTNVGDSAALVGDCGVVVEPGQPEALAAAIISSLSLDRSRTGERCRTRIVEYFCVEQLAGHTEETLKALTELCP